MKVVKLKGGLGNQMFQYAFAVLLKQLTGEEVFLDYSYFDAVKGDSIRIPRIEKFTLTIPKANISRIKEVCWMNHNDAHGNRPTLKYKLWLGIESVFNHNYYREKNRAYIIPETITKYRYFDGYWQSWRYVEAVKDYIKKDFTPCYDLDSKTLVCQRKMQNENSVFIGVRRGDYGEEQEHYGSFGIGYYKRAMQEISKKIENPTFYIFSNDIPWCKENFDSLGYKVIYRYPEDQIDDFEELMLMKSCKHAIIVNSTFNWWGAFLIDNPEKIICCPEKWFFDDKPIDIIPDGWMRIKNEV